MARRIVCIVIAAYFLDLILFDLGVVQFACPAMYLPNIAGGAVSFLCITASLVLIGDLLFEWWMRSEVRTNETVRYRVTTQAEDGVHVVEKEAHWSGPMAPGSEKERTAILAPPNVPSGPTPPKSLPVARVTVDRKER